MVVDPQRELTDVSMGGPTELPVGLCVGVVNVRLSDGGIIKIRKVVVEKSPSQTSFLITPYINKRTCKSKKDKKRNEIENIKKTCRTKTHVRFEGNHPVPFYKKGRW